MTGCEDPGHKEPCRGQTHCQGSNSGNTGTTATQPGLTASPPSRHPSLPSHSHTQTSHIFPSHTSHSSHNPPSRTHSSNLLHTSTASPALQERLHPPVPPPGDPGGQGCVWESLPQGWCPASHLPHCGDHSDSSSSHRLCILPPGPHPSHPRPSAPPILEEVLSWRRTWPQVLSDPPSQCVWPSRQSDEPSRPPQHNSGTPRQKVGNSRRNAGTSRQYAGTWHKPGSTRQYAGSWLGLLVLLSWLQTLAGSEFPDRECCDNPLYKFDPPPLAHTTPFAPPRVSYSPPEVPDFPEFAPPEVPPVPRVPDSGVLTSTPVAGSLGCLLARTLCSEDSACSQILQVIPRVCGLELVTCSTPTVTKCQAALRTLQSFPFFNPTCLCKEPRLDPDCNQFKDFLVDHPCLSAKYKESDPYPVDALPTCEHAQDVCDNDQTCRNKVQSFTKSCPVQQDQCIMTNVPQCHDSWQQLRQSPIFGCFCPSHMAPAQKSRCDKIFKVVNGNDCIDAQLPDTLRVVYTNLARASHFWTYWYRILDGPSGGGSRGGLHTHTPRSSRQTVSVDESTDTTTPYFLPTNTDRNMGGTSQSDQEIVSLRSTCHLALDACERDAACRVYLEAVKSRCVETCVKDRCMAAVKEFYRRVPDQHKLDVAFCLCKKNGNDEQCFRAQNVLHPTCAQTPVNWSGEEDDLPSCHVLARDCRDRSGCRMSLERYQQACSVDSDSKTCAGSYHECREAMVEILGTELRTNCACSGTAGDFRELFECIEYHRLFWLNPCVVDAQKDYHLKHSTLGGENTPGPRVTPPRVTPPRPPPRRTTTPRPRRTTPRPRPTPPPTRRRTPPPPRTRRPDITTTPATEPTSTIVTQTVQDTRPPPRTRQTPPPPTPMQPVQPTRPWTAPTPPGRPTRTTTRRRPPTTRRHRGGRPTKSTEPPTTVSTLPPRYCSLANEDYHDENVKYIREGFEKRLYQDDREGSQLCGCKANSQLQCTYLEEIEKKPCNTESAFYSHASPFYLAYRGQCLCYSGEFICAKHDNRNPRNPKKNPVAESPPGVWLYLGYSKKDSSILTRGRMVIQDEKNIPSDEEEQSTEVKNTIQQTVSHFTSNTNKSDCRIRLDNKINENYILKATLDEFDEYRLKKNMSDYMKWKEKDECFAALQSIAQKVNNKDADMRSHIVLSMFKVAAAEANVPDAPPSPDIGARTTGCPVLVWTTALLCILYTMGAHTQHRSLHRQTYL